MARIPRCLLAALVLLLFGAGLKAEPQRAEVQRNANQPPSHRRMLRVLGEIAERHEERTRQGLPRGRQRIDGFPASTPAEMKLRWNRHFGYYLLTLGHNDEAIEYLQTAYGLLGQLSGKITLAEYSRTMLDLAVGHLRIAETENCIHCATGESCIFPIRPSGVHTKPEGARNAIKTLEELLRSDPENLKARWLLNLTYMTLGEYPGKVPAPFLIDPEKFESDEEFPRFENVAKKLGLDTFNMSGGAICDDFDNDGDLDIVTSDWGPSGQILFFRNNADGTFSERTEEANLKGIYGGLNLRHADYDNDGDLDVLVLRGAWMGEEGRQPNSLLQNDGEARFTDVSYEVGIAGVDYPTQTASWGDFDLDGFLDLYVGNELGPCQLFHNNRDGTFTDIAEEAGVQNYGFTKGVIWGDVNQDRFPDLYVSNFNSLNRLYRNNGDGTFTDVAAEMGVTKPTRSFPVWFWDFDNDGLLDLWVGSAYWDLRYLAATYIGVPHDAELACLYRGTKEGVFEEIAEQRNLTEITMPMGCNFGDIDNDGYLDFYLGTGFPMFDGLMPNVMYWNREGKSFADVTATGGFGHLQKGHGISFADLDNDGDADVFSQMGGSYPADAFRNALFENPGFGKHWLKVRLVGTKSNRFGVGARLRLEVVDGARTRSIYRHVNSGGSFGVNPLRQEIGVGNAERISLVEVFWPKSNLTQQFRNVAVDQAIEITEGKEDFRRIQLAPFRFVGR